MDLWYVLGDLSEDRIEEKSRTERHKSSVIRGNRK
jgi:hypothetical protein